MQPSPHLASTNLSKFLVKGSYQFMASAASAPRNQILSVSLWICLSLRIKGCWFALQLHVFKGRKNGC